MHTLESQVKSGKNFYVIFLEFFIQIFQTLKSRQQTRKHSSRMRTARFPSSGGGGLSTPPICRPLPSLYAETPLDADPPPHPLMQTPPLAADPALGCRPPPSGCRPPGHVTCDACWETNPHPLLRTNTCENTTLPKTSFAGGKYHLYYFLRK